MYRVGLPFWKMLARWGVPLWVRINIERDQDTRLFIATSPDLAGLVVEAATLDELVRESHDVVDMLMEAYVSASRTAEPELRIRGHAVSCA